MALIGEAAGQRHRCDGPSALRQQGAGAFDAVGGQPAVRRLAGAALERLDEIAARQAAFGGDVGHRQVAADACITWACKATLIWSMNSRLACWGGSRVGPRAQARL
ncbi:hypothetical protein G6F31_020708 [Rhizopus arrhizus]|nr:hypothetical protein G6F31_020708 [Rhizopus arrhizus]